MLRLAAAGLLATAAPTLAQTGASVPAAAPAAAAAPDYAQDSAWLCRPGRDDACGGSLAVTAVAPSGATKVAEPKLPANPPIDCFYVYPTVSTDATPNSDASADAAERNVAHVQLAPFRAACRTFAPLYRQLTLSALRTMIATGKPSGDLMLGYDDVARAWADYLKRDNGGRGVILIGHSQGARVLKTLVQREIDGKPSPVIASYLIGSNVLVPMGKDIGGDFKATPLCRAASATNCIVSYVSFRADAPPPANTRFGRTAEAGMEVACTDPAALGGGSGALVPMFPARSIVTTEASPPPTQWAPGVTIATPYVTLPGMLTADCVRADGANYLAIHTKAEPADARIDRIPGDLVVAGQLQADWGLHLIDMTAAMGNLVDLAKTQGKAWAAKR